MNRRRLWLWRRRARARVVASKGRGDGLDWCWFGRNAVGIAVLVSWVCDDISGACCRFAWTNLVVGAAASPRVEREPTPFSQMVPKASVHEEVWLDPCDPLVPA